MFSKNVEQKKKNKTLMSTNFTEHIEHLKPTKKLCKKYLHKITFEK